MYETSVENVATLTLKQQTNITTASLKRAGFNAYGYHAGMANDARTVVQDKFMASKNIIVVATIAFGMGIDKSNIRNIVHYAVPKSLEGYSQEIGRAGRDGLESVCMIYLCAEDIKIMEEWSRADVPSLRSVKGLVGEFLELNRYAKAGDTIERNLNEESREWDIRVSLHLPISEETKPLTKPTEERTGPFKRAARTSFQPHSSSHTEILGIQIH